MLKYNKVLEAQVQFAKFCVAYNIRPNDAGDLCTLANKSRFAAVNYANQRTEKNRVRMENSDKKLTEFAKGLGFQVEWNGLAPSFYQNGFLISVPY